MYRVPDTVTKLIRHQTQALDAFQNPTLNKYFIFVNVMEACSAINYTVIVKLGM